MRKVFILAFFVLLFAAPVFSQNVRVDNVTFSSVQGFPFLPGATITICTAAATGLPCSPTVTGTCLSISDTTCNQSATQTSDALGNYGFWIQPGSYSYTVTKAGFGGFGPKALTLSCQPASTCTMTGPQTINSNLTVSGTGTFKTVNNFQNASQFSGATCGDKVNTLIAAFPLGNVTAQIDNSCGLGTITSPSTAITASANGIVLQFVQPGIYYFSGITFLNCPNCGITSLFPCAEGIGNQQNCPVSLKVGNTVNPAEGVLINNSAQAYVERVIIDGNKANNPIEGSCVKVNLSARVDLLSMTCQNFAGHGAFYSSSLSGEESCCGKMLYFFSNFNNGDGVFAANTADLMIGAGSELENPGLTASVNTNAGGTTITATSGSWSTSADLVGTMIRLVLGASIFTCKVLAIPSTTTITIANNQCWTYPGGVAGSTGALTGATLSWGSSWEGSDSPTTRFSLVDFGGAKMDCAMFYGTSAGQHSNTEMLNGGGVQCGNQAQNGVEVIGSGTAGTDQSTTSISWGHMLSNIDFLGSSFMTPTGVWNDISLLDSGNNEIIDNVFSSAAAPHQANCAAQVNESASGRSGFQALLPDTLNAVFATAQPLCDNTANGAFGLIIPVRGGGNPSGASLTIRDTTSGAGSPDWHLRTSFANLAFINNGGTTTTQFLNGGQIQSLGNAGVGGGLQMNEGTAPATGAATDYCYGDSTLHMGKCNYNNTSFFPMPQTGNTAGTHSDSGFYQTAGAAGCTTAASIGGVCATPITITWPVAFADANYKLTCTPIGPATNLPSTPYVVTPIAASVTINYFAITAAAASWPTVNCTAVHN